MNRKPTFDAKEIAEYCKLNSWNEAAIVFGCSRSTIDSACRMHGVIPLNKSALVRRQMSDWVKENNATISEAVFHFGSTRQRVGQACTENGVHPKKEGSSYKIPAPISNFEILVMLIQGFLESKIAEEMAVSRQRVNQIKVNAESVGLLGENAIIELKQSSRQEEDEERCAVVIADGEVVGATKAPDTQESSDTDEDEQQD